MLNFPDSPTTNQVFYGPANQVWLWDGQKWVAQAQATYTPPVAPPDGTQNVGRNLVHNPVYTVQQRGAGSWTTTSTYTADRWQLFLNTDTDSVTLVSLTDADRSAIGDETAQYCWQDVVTGNSAAAALSFVAHKVEGARRLSGKSVTLSFWAKAAAGTPSIGVGWGQNFGTGGSPSAAVYGTGVAVPISTTWTRYSRTIALPSTAGKTFGTSGGDFTEIDLYFSTSTNNASYSGIGVQSGTFSLWGVQLEIGTVATPLDKGGSPQAVLAECQRFYYVTGVNCNGASPVAGAMSFGATMLFPVPMRATPTVVLSGQTYVNASALTVTANLNTGAYTGITVTAGGNVFGAGGTAAFSADL